MVVVAPLIRLAGGRGPHRRGAAHTIMHHITASRSTATSAFVMVVLLPVTAAPHLGGAPPGGQGGLPPAVVVVVRVVALGPPHVTVHAPLAAAAATAGTGAH